MSQYYFKNKNKIIAIVEFIPEANTFINILEWMDIEIAPLSIQSAFNNKSANTLKALNLWYQNRGIPQYRDELDDLMIKLGIQNISDIKSNSFSLSLSDQYWFHPKEKNILWSDVNFFTKDFDFLDFTNAVFSPSTHQYNSMCASPNFSTDGMVKKAWFINGAGDRLLLKGGYRKSRQEPFNERLASLICAYLHFDYVHYTLMKVANQIVSACPTFIEPDTELIFAIDIYNSRKKGNSINDYTYYIELLEKHGIENAREKMEEMLVLDYIMLNEDRHMRNFGVIRDVNSTKWLKVAPIYDTGQSLLSQTDFTDMNFNIGNGKFFSNTQMPFEKIISHVQNLSRFDFSGLHHVIDAWEVELHLYREDSRISVERINRIIEGVHTRIDKIISIQKGL